MQRVLNGKTAVITGSLIPNISGSPNYRLIAERVRQLVLPFEKDEDLNS